MTAAIDGLQQAVMLTTPTDSHPAEVGRFWYPSGVQPFLTPEGYLADPTTDEGQHHNAALVRLEALAARPCLLLLGQPGSGKTTELEAIQARGAGEVIVPASLREFGSEEGLRRGLFEQQVEPVLTGDARRVVLVLDALDEGLLTAATLADALIRELRIVIQEAAGRLALRVSCRTAELPYDFEKRLRELWEGGDQSDVVSVWELAALTERDVQTAATRAELDPVLFMSAIEVTGAGALAARPVTLQLLLNVYARHRAFPDKTALYRQGLLGLCEETNRSRYTRQSAGHAGVLSARQRYAVATRIAAISMFCNRAAIWTDVDRGDVPDTDVAQSAIVGGEEPTENVSVAVSGIAVEELLRGTALFSVRGPQRLGWAHQTYAEFLAAEFVRTHELPAPQIDALLFVAVDDERRIPPQLREVAAWLATGDARFRDVLLSQDPSVLLRTDVPLDDAFRGQLLEGLLDRAGRFGFNDLARTDDTDLRRALSFSGIGIHLARTLDPTVSDARQELALDIAGACRCTELAANAASIAERAESAPSLRYAAVNALGTMAAAGHAEPVLHLMNLAQLSPASDLDDEILGIALTVLWPTWLDVEEVAALLRPVQNEDLIGMYRLALSRIAEQCAPSDAIRLVSALALHERLSGGIESTVDTLLVRAWEAIGDEADAGNYARVLATRALERDDVWSYRREETTGFPERVSSDPARRRRVLVALIHEIAGHATPGTILEVMSWHGASFVTREDVRWLASMLPHASAPAEAVISVILWHAFDWRDPQAAEALVGALEQSAALRKQFSWPGMAVDLHSPDAAQFRSQHLRWQDWQERLAQQEPRPKRRERMPADVIEEGLRALERGDARWWGVVVRAVLSNPDGSVGRDLGCSDLREAPGWTIATTSTRQRLVTAARWYLTHSDPDATPWFGTGQWPLAALTGYHALRLVRDSAPDRYVTLTSDDWTRWIPTILAFPWGGDDEGRTIRSIICDAARQAPAAFVQRVVDLITADDLRQNGTTVLGRLDEAWSPELEAAVLGVARDPDRSPNTVRLILGHLLGRGALAARSTATQLLAGLHDGDGARARAVVVAQAMLMYDTEASWADVWPIISADMDAGRAMFLEGAFQWDDAGVTAKLSVAQLRDAFRWFVDAFPPAEDPVHPSGGHAVSPRDQVVWIRNGILDALVHRGSSEAIAALKTLQSELPQLPYLGMVVASAIATTSRTSWVPFTPTDLRNLAAAPERRLVRSGDELLDVVLESLDRLQQELTGETPSVEGLWDERAHRVFRPKAEAALANLVRRHLARDLGRRGVVANREVEIRPSFGSTGGARTDIHVNAIARGPRNEPADVLTVVIEVKGAWHRDVLTAMQTQLVERYLVPATSARHGIYLVGWYSCSLWSKSDRRSRSVKALGTLDGVRQGLERQAARFSGEGRVVRAVLLDARLTNDDATTKQPPRNARARSS